ncbi:zinc finger CCCH domain-containing protein [Musa troglodytarum]|uniref:Zinc finger CCCH domain-containing protein n=1 Tax=Musa troglodytarum TaxID=320322 RepID=A0A9E7GG34_9LILI|nr:zinc finger CCCH domain-containing protein [Musa troglodytarum]
MDANEATRMVFSKIQNLDPENAPRIMGLLLLQDDAEKVIRLAFGHEALLHTVVVKAKEELGLAPPPSAGGSAAPPCLLRLNSDSRLVAVSSPFSWAPHSVFSGSGSRLGDIGLDGSLEQLQNSDELISPSNFSSSPFHGGGGGHVPDQLSFLSNHSLSRSSKPSSGGDVFGPGVECWSPRGNGDASLFPYGLGWGLDGYQHQRSCSAAADDLCLGAAPTLEFGWEPCLYFARGYCKNGTACRFLHGLPEEAAATVVTGAKMDAVMQQQQQQQQRQELLTGSKSQRMGGASHLMAAGFPYSPTGSVRPSPSSTSSKFLSFLLQQQQNESQRAAALMPGGDEANKLMGGSRIERSDLLGNPGSRQIYLTFPADSTFREEDVSNHFSIYGPVQDVRIPYQQKRMFGFVTFVYPETVRLILAKGNPHFVCDSRVLVKPYKEKAKLVPDKYRHSSAASCLGQKNLFCSSDFVQQQQQQAERADFSTPTALDAREAYHVHQLGARMLYGSTSEELLWRRKLEEQHQAAELQRAIELQGRRFMGLQILDLNNRSFPSSAPSSSIDSPTITAARSVSNPDRSSSRVASPTEGKPRLLSFLFARAFRLIWNLTSRVAESLSVAEPEEKVNSSPGPLLLQQQHESADEDGDSRGSADPNLPDSPFASPTKSSSMLDSFSTGEDMTACCIANNGSSGNNSFFT